MSVVPRVSLCMIVKDEEKDLPRCLESIRDLVDEIVIIDTGSSDRTVEIARSFQARVHFFPWCNDFALARNESLRHTTGDWILWMDADETLNCCGSPDCLRRTVAIPGSDAYLVPIRSYTNDDKFDFHYAIRVFRNNPEIRFEGKVHENVDSSLLRLRANAGYAPFVIDHYGYAITQEQMEEKLLRNLELLEKQRDQDPRNPFVQYYIGLTLIGLDREEESLQALRKALEANPPTPNLKCLILNLMALHYLSQEDHAFAEETAKESLRIIPRQNTAKLLLGIASYNQGKHREALACLLPAYQFLRIPIERRKTEVSQEHSYSEFEILAAIAKSYARMEEFANAIVFFQRYLKIHEGDADVYRIMGICYLNLQDFTRAIEHFKKAEALGISLDSIALPMAYSYMKEGNVTEAGNWILAANPEAFEDPQFSTLFQSFVQWYFEQGAIPQLCETLETLSRRIAHHPLILDALGNAQIKAGDYQKAIKAYQSLYAVSGPNKEVARRLAALYHQVGNSHMAGHYLLLSKESNVS